jgi:hypothetical protein
MDLSTVANVATALTVITGVGFGLVEAQRSRRAREERAAYAAVQALLSQAWMKSMIVVHSIPDGSSSSAIEANAEVLNAAHSVGVTLEGLGYSVYARIVPLRVAADLVGGTVRLAWRKLKPYIEEERRRSGSQKTFRMVPMARHTTGTTFTWKNKPAGRCAGSVSRLEALRWIGRSDGRCYVAIEEDCSIHLIVSRKSCNGDRWSDAHVCFSP